MHLRAPKILGEHAPRPPYMAASGGRQPVTYQHFFLATPLVEFRRDYYPIVCMHKWR